MSTRSSLLSTARSGFTRSLPVLRSAGLVGSAEIVNRITHVVTAIALARALTVAEFGIAAAAITTHELTRAFIQNGLGARIVTASEDELAEVTAAVNQLNWWLAIALAVSQLIISATIHFFYDSPTLALAIGLLACVHVIYPFSMVQVFLAQREGRWRCVSGAVATQAVVDNLMTASLAIAGFGIWAIIVPKILVAPLWVIWHRVSTPWKAVANGAGGLRRKLVVYSLQVLGVEMLATLRAHGDKAFIGVLLGPQALGFYAFASNIGNSITIGLSQCIGAVMLPHLRRGHESGRVLDSFTPTLASMMIPLVPVILAQALLAWWYVPMLFGAKWADAIPLLVVMSMFSMARPVAVATSQLLRATGETLTDMLLATSTTVLFFAGLLVGSSQGLLGATLGASLGMAMGAGIALAVAVGRSRTAGPSLIEAAAR
jgi:teichuronic acid exporter